MTSNRGIVHRVLFDSYTGLRGPWVLAIIIAALAIPYLADRFL